MCVCVCACVHDCDPSDTTAPADPADSPTGQPHECGPLIRPRLHRAPLVDTLPSRAAAGRRRAGGGGGVTRRQGRLCYGAAEARSRGGQREEGWHVDGRSGDAGAGRRAKKKKNAGVAARAIGAPIAGPLLTSFRGGLSWGTSVSHLLSINHGKPRKKRISL